MLEQLIKGDNAEAELQDALYEIHRNGPGEPIIFEKLAYLKKFHGELFSKYESRIISSMGLFYKAGPPMSVIEEVYKIFSDAILEETGENFTPTQASAYKAITQNRNFSFSAPTSSGKSYLFRQLIKETREDIVIVVPSRALIAEYYYEVINLVNKSTLVLQFIDNINTDKAMKRVFIVTPERGSELFKFKNAFNVGLILLDEAQISEDEVRGMTFDSFVRRADKDFPNAKKVFAHPFVDNPNAQLEKHGFDTNSSSRSYNLHTVGKIFLSVSEKGFKYFSPNVECPEVELEKDIVSDILSAGGTLLVYMSKSKIYDGSYHIDFSEYINLCPKVTDQQAKNLIDELRTFIGAAKGESEKRSVLISLLEQGIVIHHGSMPLRARLLVEDFVKKGFARICFATSTLNQGINMPFDVVWIDNFNRMDAMTLKNLIGRSGRTTGRKNFLDYGFTVIKKENVATFKTRFKDLISLKQTSSLDNPIDGVSEDLRDLVEAIKENSFDAELHLTKSQVERIKGANIDKQIKFILDTLLLDGKPITGKAYYMLKDSDRKKIKDSLKIMYLQHLRRSQLSVAESGVLSAAIPILLWHIQGKSFSEIVSLRHAFLTEKDKRREIVSKVRNGELTVQQGRAAINALKIRFTPIPTQLPNVTLKSAPLFERGTSVSLVDFDIIVYDTYDYLDKVISLSLADPICAVLELYASRNNDQRADQLKKFIKFGTDDDIEIWLLRYGFGFEEIQWIKEHVSSIDMRKISFKDSISELAEDRLDVIRRYL